MNTYEAYAEKQEKKLNQKWEAFHNRKEDEFTKRDELHYQNRLLGQQTALFIVKHKPDQANILKAIKDGEEQTNFFFGKTKTTCEGTDAHTEAWRLFHFNSAYKDMLYQTLTAHDNKYDEEQEKLRLEKVQKGQKKK